MFNLLVFALVVVLIAALVVWAVRSVPIPEPLGAIVQLIIILIAAVAILSRLMGVI